MRHESWHLLKSALALGALLALSGLACAAPAPAGPVPVGERLPDVRMLGLNGPDRHLSLFFGRKLIINVWASWCGPCRAEAASLERFAWGNAGAKYAVIGVSTDDDRSAAQKWLLQSKATLPHFIDRGLVLESLLGASHIPISVLVDEEGRVVARIEGARDWELEESRMLIERLFQRSARARGKARMPTD
jgi:thiol-disulfide isomerase/thioredoxin